MQTRGVVEAVDVVSDGAVGLSLAGIRPRGFFGLERGEEALGDGVVPAIALAAHAGHEAEWSEGAGEVGAGVLATAIGMEQHAAANRGDSIGVVERLLDQVVGHALGHAVAEHLAGFERDHDGEIKPAFARGSAGRQ